MRLGRLAAVLAAACIIGSVSASATEEAKEQRGTVTVSASGVVKAVPDRARIDLGIVTEAETAPEAQAQNEEAVNRVIEALTGKGVAESSIQTSGYDLFQRYDYEEERYIGYTLTTTLAVQDLPIGETGEVLSACTEAGATAVNGISFTCSTYDDAYEEALGEAVKAAGRKAGAIAEAAGADVGEMISVEEGWQDTSLRYSSSRVSMTEAMADTAAMKVMPGESEITANVTVTYALIPRS